MYQPLLDYIKQTRAAGMPDDQIRQELLKVNWKKEIVEGALKNSGEADNKKPKAKAIIFVILALLAAGFIAFAFWYKDFNLTDKILKLIAN